MNECEMRWRRLFCLLDIQREIQKDECETRWRRLVFQLQLRKAYYHLRDDQGRAPTSQELYDHWCRRTTNMSTSMKPALFERRDVFNITRTLNGWRRLYFKWLMRRAVNETAAEKKRNAHDDDDDDDQLDATQIHKVYESWLKLSAVFEPNPWERDVIYRHITLLGIRKRLFDA